MKRVICILRPHKLEEIKAAIADLGITGLTVNDVRGTGASPEPTTQPGVIALPVKARLTVCVPDELVEDVIKVVLDFGATGLPGDGKIFVEPLCDIVRIRTGERGNSAI